MDKLNKEGFTLIEVVVAVIIATTLLLILTSTMTTVDVTNSAREFAKRNEFTFDSCQTKDRNRDGYVTCQLFTIPKEGYLKQSVVIQCSTDDQICHIGQPRADYFRN